MPSKVCNYFSMQGLNLMLIKGPQLNYNSEILHQAWQYYCNALCKILKQQGDWNRYYGHYFMGFECKKSFKLELVDGSPWSEWEILDCPRNLGGNVSYFSVNSLWADGLASYRWFSARKM